MSKKLTIEDIKEKVKELPLELISTTYTPNEILTWKRTDCKHLIYKKVHKIVQQHNCPICYGGTAYTNELITARLDHKGKKIKLLTPNVTDCKTIVDWQCTVENCGYVWSVSADSILNHKVVEGFSGCPECARNNRPKPAIKELNNRIKEFNIELISEVIDDVKHIVTWKCKDHKFYVERSLDIITNSKGINCRYCRAEETNKTLIKNKRDIILLSEKQEDMISPLKWKCTREHCLHEWEVPAMSIMGNSQSGCPECGKITRNITNAKRHKKSWLNIPLTVYILELYNRQEKFYKLGITERTVKARMSKRKYDYNIIKEYKTDKYNGIMVEAYLLQHFHKYKYVPQQSFGGYKECFSCIDLEYIDKYMKEDTYVN